MIALFRRYQVYYLLCFSIVLVGLLVLLTIDKGDIVLFFNGVDSAVLDSIFFYVTKLGELIGGILVFVLVYFFGFEKKYLLVCIASILITSLAAQGLKNTIYKSERRPEYSYNDLKYIEGLERHKQNSFPSGHTTVVFTFTTLTALGVRKSVFQWILPFLGAAVGISRVYLGQHYFNDVVAGAVLGLLLTSIVHLVFIKYNWISSDEELD